MSDPTPTPTSGVLLQPAELSALMASGGVVVLDTRDPEVYAEGHLPGAVNVREIFTYLATSDEAGMTELTGTFARLFGEAGLDGTKTAVLYEDAMDTGFGQSCRGYFLLSYLGYPSTKVLHGGYTAWTAAGLPVDTAVPAPVTTEFPLDVREGLVVTKEVMLAALDDDAVTALDCRDADEWFAESSSPYGVDFCPRKGRLPGAVWLEWYTTMTKDPTGVSYFRSPQEIAALAGKVGVGAGTDTIIYCFKGARASNTFLALHEAGITSTRIYFGSWNEWSRDPALPIEEGAPDPARPAVSMSTTAA
jgi:thiosulfate/3-mercaptopyruvate sulfurtransferase